jgi:hypothetical protein
MNELPTLVFSRPSNIALDHESRAERFLDAFSAVHDILVLTVIGAEVDAGNLAQLLSILADEARAVVIPSQFASNDDADLN